MSDLMANVVLNPLEGRKLQAEGVKNSDKARAPCPWAPKAHKRLVRKMKNLIVRPPSFPVSAVGLFLPMILGQKMSNVILKLVCLAGASVISLGAHQAMATCSTPLTQAQISTALEGNYASGSNGSESWNEGHCAGNLYDYKKGPTDPIDPQKQIGIYSYVAVGRSGAAVQYSYTGGPIFTYYVQSLSAGSYKFCPTAGGTDLTITVVTKAGCPSS